MAFADNSQRIRILIRVFLISFLISLPFWLGVNLSITKFENFFYTSFYQPPAEVFLADISAVLKSPSPTPEAVKAVNLEIGAKSVLSVAVNELGQDGSTGSPQDGSAGASTELSRKSSPQETIIYEKNSEKILPIASLTKLMTAIIVTEYYDPTQIITISKEAISQEGDYGQLKIEEKLSVENLLYIALIESSNDAAYSLAEQVGESAFVDLMNLKAKEIGLENTNFTTVTGLDGLNNYSTAQDLAKLAKYIIKNSPKIQEILISPEFNLYSPDGVFHHQLRNTNLLLGEIENIVFGKTGWSEDARGCLLIVLKTQDGYLLNIILGSEDRFEEMKQLIKTTL